MSLLAFSEWARSVPENSVVFGSVVPDHEPASLNLLISLAFEGLAKTVRV